MNTNKLMPIANTIANIAISLEKKVFYILIIAIVSIITIAWHWIDFNAFSIGSGLKLLLLSLPVLLWYFLWNLIKQLTELPQTLSELKEVGEENLSLVFDANKEQEKRLKTSVIINLFRLIKAIREPEIFENVFACVQGITLLANPISFITLIFSAILIIIYTFVALVFAIF